jgi:AraC-like DNA-binding protein
MQRLFYFLLFFLTTAVLHSQVLNETEIKETRKIQELLVYQPKTALKEAIKVSKSKNILFSLHGKFYIASYYYNQSNFILSKEHLLSLLHLIEQNKEKISLKEYQDLIGMSVNKLFYIHKNLGEYDLAVLYLDKYKNKVAPNRFNEQYGLIKVAMGDCFNGIPLLKKELKTSPHLKLGVGEKKTMNKKLFADKYNIIGEAYQKYYIQTKKNVFLDSANYYFNVAARMMLNENFYPEYTKALLYMREAKSAALRGNYIQSLSLYKKGIKYPSIQENIRTIQLFDLGMADCFHHLNKIDSALIYCEKYIDSYQKTKVSKENLLMAYNIMTQCYKEKNDSKKAYLYAQKSLELIQSIEKIKNESLNFLHNYDLNLIKEESNKIIASRKYFKIFFFSLLIILAFVIYRFYYYYKLQKERHQRFLKIIQQLRESKKTGIKNTVEQKGDQTKQSIDEDLVEKLSIGLKKLEQKELFLDPNFKLTFVAKKLNTNTAYLSQYFNQVMHKTFSEYTQELRIQYVLQKLIDVPQFRKYTMQAIAEEVGYKDANTFVRVFKKQTRLSPNYYIEKLEKTA